MTQSFQEKIAGVANDLRTQFRDLNIDTFFKLFDTSDTLERYYEQKFHIKTISRAGFIFLNTLILCGGTMQQTEIGNAMSRSRHATSKLISTLEKHGFVVSNQVGGDRRKKEVSITIRGLTTAKRHNTLTRQRVSREVLGALSEAEIKSLNQSLAIIKKHVNVLYDKL
jgi:DNA-binding MarR family transcriptional regulator